MRLTTGLFTFGAITGIILLNPFLHPAKAAKWASKNELSCGLSSMTATATAAQSSLTGVGPLVKISDFVVNCNTDGYDNKKLHIGKVKKIQDVGWCALLDGGSTNAPSGYRVLTLQGTSGSNSGETLPIRLYNDHNKTTPDNPIGYPSQGSAPSAGGEVWNVVNLGKTFTVPLYYRLGTNSGYRIHSGKYVGEFPLDFWYGANVSTGKRKYPPASGIGNVERTNSRCKNASGKEYKLHEAATYTITIDVKSACSISSSTTSLNFGKQTSLQNIQDLNANIAVDCGNDFDQTYTVTISKGNHSINGQRYMALDDSNTAASDKLIKYDFYKSLNGVQSIWGEGNDALNGSSGDPMSGPENYQLIAKVPPQDTPQNGTYKDAVVVTLTPHNGTS